LLFVNGVSASAMVIAFAAGREHNRPEAAGAALGFVNTAVMASGAIFQPLIGALLDLSWDGAMVEGARLYAVADYRLAFLSLIAISLAGITGVAFSRETYCRNVWRDAR
jgi:hypothetical protein